MNLSRRVLVTSVLLYLIGQLFFLIMIQFPRGHNFDEFHYVPSAKQFLELKENQNYEHPPLAKELMAMGIVVGGDRPFGWRLMSTVFGALTLVAMYLWALALFRDEKTALWAAALTLFNQLLYVQARIGMLDTFMFCFIAFAMAAFTRAWDPKLDARSVRRLLYASGAFHGLALASKWYGIIPLALCVALVLLQRLLRNWGVQFDKPRESDWFQSRLWADLRMKDWVIAFLLMPLGFYYLTFLPFFFVAGGKYGLTDILFTMQYKMWDGQSRVVGSHPYMSHWMDWPLLKRPIWYAFDKEGNQGEFVRGVLLLGNPWVMWTGVVAVLAALWGWIMERRRDAFLVVAAYAGLFLCWLLIPRKVSFYYYYYPAGMTLSLALAYFFERWDSAWAHSKNEWLRSARWIYLGVAAAFFIYFFPILSALKIRSDTFSKWMWFRSWI